MGLGFQQLEMNGLMCTNSLSIRMTPLYHIILSRIAFKKKNGFVAQKLSNYIDVGGGEDIYAKYYSFDETDYVYLSSKNIKNEDIDIEDDPIFIYNEMGKEFLDKNKILKENDIIVTRSGTVGVSVLITKDIVTKKTLIPSGYIKILRTQGEVLPKFLLYYLRNPIIRELMEIEATGKDQKNLSHDAVKNLPFPLISIENQKNVLGSVENIEKKIEELKKQYKTEEEIINESFSKVLKYERAIPKTDNYRKEINLTNIDDRYMRTDPDYFMFLENYKTFLEKNKNVEFSDLSEFLEDYESGKPIKRNDYVDLESNYIHIVPRDIKNTRLKIKDAIFINYNKGEELKQFRCNKDDILLVLSSNVGDAAIFDLKDKNYTISHYICKLKVKGLNKKFLLYFFYFEPIKQYFRAIETGKGQKNLAKYYIFHLKIPNIRNQEEIVKEIETNLEKHEKIKKDILRLRKEIHEVFWEELHKYTIQKAKM